MIINHRKNIAELKQVFLKIFCNNDPFGRMFKSSILSKVLLYPTNGYHLSKKQYSALINTLNSIGETFFYVSEIEGTDYFKKSNCMMHKDAHLEVTVNTSYYEYENTNIYLENAIYSHKGQWGAIISHEDHAVLGGSKEFIAIFKNFYPEWKDDQIKFLNAFEYWNKIAKIDLSWLAPFISYINE